MTRVEGLADGPVSFQRTSGTPYLLVPLSGIYIIAWNRIRSIGGLVARPGRDVESTGARKRHKAVHTKPGGEDRGQVVAAKVMRAGVSRAAGQRRQRAGWCVSHRRPVAMRAFKVCESTAPRYVA